MTGFASAPRAADDALYQALGAQGGIAVLVDEYLDVIADDIRVAPTFADTDIPHLREKLVEYFCMLSGGPCKYTSDPMEVVHRDMNITEAQFNAVVEDLQESMAHLNLPEPLRIACSPGSPPCARRSFIVKLGGD